ncbi:MAG: tetratricopeptide repeat protein [Akkermansia sp.]
MKTNRALLFALTAVGVSLLTMCQNSPDDAIPAGTIRLVDAEADALMAEANAFYQAGEYKKARKKLNRINVHHRTASCAPLARYMTAQCYEKTEDYRDAFKQYQRVVEDFAGSPLYMKSLAAQLEMAHHAAKGELKGEVLWGAWKVDMDSSVVIEWFRTIIKNAPYNEMAASTASILAQYFMDRERYIDARATYTLIVENYPNSKYAPSAQLMVAHLWATSETRGDHNLANLSKAEESYEEFSLRFPDHKDAGKALAQAASMRSLMVDQELDVALYYMNRSKQYDAAIFCLKEVIRKKSINPAAAAEASKLLPQAQQLRQEELAAQQAS